MASRTRRGPGMKDAARELLAPWWSLPREDMGGEVRRLVEHYKKQGSARRSRYVRNLSLFERRPVLGYSSQSYGTGDGDGDDQPFDLDRLGLVRSAVASAVSAIYAPQRPKPQFQTSGADWATRRRAYKLDRICEGVLSQRQSDQWINVWALMVDAGTECALQGDAFVWVQADRKRGRISHTLVLAPDVFVDPAEGRAPQNLFFRRPIAADECLRLFPKSRAAVASAPDYDWYGRASSDYARAVKVVELVYAYRLPTGKDEPGTWCVSCGGEVLDSGPWTAPMFPLVRLRWEPHRDGYWSSGIGSEGGRMARECGELDQRLYLREVIASGNKVFYEQGTVKPDDLVLNDACVAVPVAPGATVMPTYQQQIPFSPMELDFRNTKVRDYWDAIGISQVSAAARREQGVTSGVAIRTLNDTKAGRQLLKAQRYEQAFVDLAHQYVWRLRELAEDDPKYVVRWSGKAAVRELAWSDADVDDEMFSVSVAPASALPHDPAGRQEMVQDMYKANMISQATAKTLMSWPDLDSEQSVENAESDYVDALIERYLDADRSTWGAADYQAPQAFIADKQRALRRFAAAWFRARVDQAALPTLRERRKVDFNLGLLTRWIREMDSLMTPPPSPPDQTAPVAPQAPAAAA